MRSGPGHFVESSAALSGVAMIGLAQWLWDEFTISGQTLSRELRALGYRKLSARPRATMRKMPRRSPL